MQTKSPRYPKQSWTNRTKLEQHTDFKLYTKSKLWSQKHGNCTQIDTLTKQTNNS